VNTFPSMINPEDPNLKAELDELSQVARCGRFMLAGWGKAAEETERAREYFSAADSFVAQFSEDFKEKARSWRALATKPELPEEARKHRVLAENAVQEKDLDRALAEYEAALKSYPFWPEGQFNAAMLCGEKKFYAKAIRYMQHYLDLLPD